jgi:hypothetical protein
MIPDYDLPVIEKNDEFVIYQMPEIELANGIIAEAVFQIHGDTPDEPELILNRPEDSDVDMRGFLTEDTQERIIKAFKDQGIEVLSATPGDDEDEYIIHVLELSEKVGLEED